MKKANRILSLVLAAVMIFAVACPTSFAYNNLNIYETAEENPLAFMNAVGKYEFDVNQGAGYVLDLLDGLLHGVNLVMENEQVLDEWYGDAWITVRFRNIDEVLWTLYNAVHGIADKNETCIKNILTFKLFGGINLTGAIDDIAGALDLGDLESLTVSALGDQNSASRTCRNVPYNASQSGKNDLDVLKMLTQFLSDNRDTLGKVFDSTISFGILNSAIKGIDGVGPFLENFPGAIKNLLYSKLLDTTVEEAPSGWTVDAGVQQLVNWALVTGTGTEGSDGGKSILGENFDAFLPAIANYPGGADLRTQNFYHLVNNAINALLSGMVSDLLKDLLVDALGIDKEANGGLGNTEIMADPIFAAVTGAIESLCVANGAPEIVYSENAKNYPIPKMNELLDWFFDGGGLATFVSITYEGISITDNFMALLQDVIRILPGLFPLFGLEVPKGLTYTTEEMTEKDFGENGEPLYTTFEGDVIYKPDPDNYPDDYAYVSNDAPVNTSDPSGANYHDPRFINDKFVLSDAQIYGALLKILLNTFIDGCYFPAWADDIASVGAYALGSLAANYLPENNYLDRLDRYHYVDQLGGSYTPKGTGASVTSLPYTETFTVSGKTVTVPRAAMDIGFSLLSYLLNGWNDFQSSLGFITETDTNWETYLFEFLIWGAGKYMPALVGRWDAASHQFVAATSGATETFRTVVNGYVQRYYNLRQQYAPSGNAASPVNNIPAGQMRDIVYGLIDDTLFKIIPIDWLPAWVAQGGSSGLINDWLFDSVVNFDLQKLVSLFSINPNGELAKNSTIKVILNLLDRVLGIVFGGNALLPSCFGSGSPRSVLSSSTSLTTLESLIGSGANLKAFGISLLYYLNIYVELLGKTIFPLIVSGSVKDATYYPSANAQSTVNYLNGHQITFSELKDYVDANSGDMNATAWSGPVYYDDQYTAKDVAEAIGDTSFTAEGRYALDANGHDTWRVDFPLYYANSIDCRKAAEYIPDSYASSQRVGTSRVNQLYVSIDYRTGTADETENKIYDAGGTTVVDRYYTYSNISRALPDSGSNGYRTGPYGEVQFENSARDFRSFGREDYRTNGVYNYNRFDNAVEDASEFLTEFQTYAESTLPGAYGDWLMYFVKMQLKRLNIYDANDDGVIDDNDGAPGVPSSDYPFYKSSGSTGEYILTEGTPKTWSTKTWNFKDPRATLVVQDAIAYANATEEDGTSHDVVLGAGDTECVVRLALGNISFDINAENPWAGLTTANFTAISNTCNNLGLTFNADTHEITRKAFDCIGASFGYASASYFDGTTTGTISLTPAGSFVLGGKDADATRNDIQEAFVSFAKNAENYNKLLNNHYDNISWRASTCESTITTSPNTNTLQFMLALTSNAYDSGQGRNKTINNFGETVTAYTRTTYNEFQKAYEYANQLITSIGNGEPQAQSLVSKATTRLIEAYKKLVEFEGKADWTEFDYYVEQARQILEGPLCDPANIALDLGYTQESVTRLQNAYDFAVNFKADNYETFDSDNNPDVDQQTNILIGVIASLAFPVGLNPSAIISEDYVEEGGGTHIVPDSSYTVMINPTTPDSRQFMIIAGLTEGEGFTNKYTNGSNEEANIFNATGFNAEASENDFVAHPSNYGNGTGSYIVGSVNYTEIFRYYAVLFGDINGDARIDGTDKTIVNVFVVQNTVEEQQKYHQVAADVNFDGEVDTLDIQVIDGYYKHKEGATIDQNATPNESWFNATATPSDQG